MHLLAKGSKRPKSKAGGAIDILSEGDLVFSSSGRNKLDPLIEFSETVSHLPLRNNTQKLNTALYMVELVSLMLAERDPFPKVFDLLHRILERLKQPEAPVEAVLAYFQWRLLRNVGLLGELKACVSCQTLLAGNDKASRRDLHFSSSKGGLLCGACEVATTEKYRVDDATMAGLAAIAAAQAGAKVTLPAQQSKSVNCLLAYHISQQIGKKPKMAKYVIGV